MPAPAAGVPLLLGKVTLLWRHFLLFGVTYYY